MSKSRRVFLNARITVNVSMVLDEAEARALAMIADYGVKPLLDVYRRCLGTAMNDHQVGLESLFEACRTEIPGYLRQIDEARKHLAEKGKP